MKLCLRPFFSKKNSTSSPADAVQDAARGASRGSLFQGGVLVDLEVAADRLEDLLEEGRVAPLPRLDRALAQRQLLVGDDEVGVEEHLVAAAG